MIAIPPLPRPQPADEECPLDETVWNVVHGEIGDGAMRVYVESYLELLSERIDGAEGATAAGQRSAAIRLLSDLRVGSGILGADRLAALVATVEAALRRGPPGDRAVDWSRLRAQAHVAERALRRALSDLERG